MRKAMNVVILEPVSSGWKLIPKAKELNHTVIVLTYDQGERIIPAEFLRLADRIERVDTNDDQAVIDLARKLDKELGIDAVIPGFEYYVPLSNRINHLLGNAGLKPEVVNHVRYKDLMRTALADAGVRVPRYRLVTDAEELEAAAAYVGFPLVAKPVDCSGSFNVRKANNHSELEEAYRRISEMAVNDLEQTARGDVLLEEYLQGPEYSVEGLVDGEMIHYFSITEKLLGPEPYFVEVGHIVSAPLDAEAEETIHHYVGQVIKALGINMGPFHAEIRLTSTGPVLIEIGVRLAGDYICDLIYHAKGIDLYKLMIDSYLGSPLSLPEQTSQRVAGVRFFVRENLKRYDTVEGLEQLRALDGLIDCNLTIPTGQEIPEANSFMGRIGYFAVVGDDYDRLKETLLQGDRQIKFKQLTKK
jgi:biotin carboxylase